MRTHLRIVAGSLRGRKLTCAVHPGLRPTPDMVREALFSILGDAVPNRPFFDLFAGTGIVGLEALSRGARSATFVERDFRQIEEIGKHVREFGLADRVTLSRSDVYRWVERWTAPAEPANVFLSPPFGDYERRPEDLLLVVAELQTRLAPDSVLVVQADRHTAFDHLPSPERWEERLYGRNQLLIWVKPLPETP
jgi:16S rRNA (guanine(966)-N(2))-methyltransferase RsmD